MAQQLSLEESHHQTGCSQQQPSGPHEQGGAIASDAVLTHQEHVSVY